jgi:hypothetical protein
MLPSSEFKHFLGHHKRLGGGTEPWQKDVWFFVEVGRIDRSLKVILQ